MRAKDNRAAAALMTAVVGLVLTSPARAAVYVAEDRLWDNGVVPFEWDPNMSFANRIEVVAAMNVWQQVARVTFVLRTNETDYVLIQNAPGTSGSSSASIGRDGGRQDLFIRQNLSNITVYGLAHELGHVLGFFHTHQRTDRANYVTVYNSRMNDCRSGNFTIASNSLAYPRNRMDFDSVMSYGQCIFSNCGLTLDPACGCNDPNCARWTSNGACSEFGVVCCAEDPDNCRVIEIDDPEDAALWQNAMGQRSHLSAIDALTMAFLYPEPDWRFVERNYTGSDESGTFHNPYLNLADGLAGTPQGGTLWAQPGTYTGLAGQVLNKPMLIAAPLGGVTLR